MSRYESIHSGLTSLDYCPSLVSEEVLGNLAWIAGPLTEKEGLVNLSGNPGFRMEWSYQHPNFDCNYLVGNVCTPTMWSVFACKSLIHFSFVCFLFHRIRVVWRPLSPLWPHTSDIGTESEKSMDIPAFEFDTNGTGRNCSQLSENQLKILAAVKLPLFFFLLPMCSCLLPDHIFQALPLFCAPSSSLPHFRSNLLLYSHSSAKCTRRPVWHPESSFVHCSGFPQPVW